MFLFHIWNSLLTKFLWSRWLDNGLVLFLRVYRPRLGYVRCSLRSNVFMRSYRTIKWLSNRARSVPVLRKWWGCDQKGEGVGRKGVAFFPRLTTSPSPVVRSEVRSLRVLLRKCLLRRLKKTLADIQRPWRYAWVIAHISLPQKLG